MRVSIRCPETDDFIWGFDGGESEAQEIYDSRDFFDPEVMSDGIRENPETLVIAQR